VAALLTVVYPAELRGTRVAFGGETPTSVGREGEGMTVAHATVSRRHLELVWDGQARTHRARDLESRNGSSVDGVRLGCGELRALDDGAVVRIGDVLAVYERARDEDAPEVAAGIPGEAQAVRELRARIAAAARDRAPALLVGETGSGKEWVARALHHASGRSGPFVAVNCAALSATLVESELFGHVKGAFTGAGDARPGYLRAAHGGTILLDEIGDLPAALQPKLLRVIQEREVQPVGSVQPVRVNVRVVAATHVDLARAAEEGRFRPDLYARLSLWEVTVPPLRARRVDLLDWLARLHRRWLDEEPRAAAGPPLLSPDAAEAVLVHAWPHNLRGLDRLLRELGARGGGERRVELEDLPAWVRAKTGAPVSASAVVEPPRTPMPRRSLDAAAFTAAYAELGGSVSALARRFGCDRRQIYRWIEACGLRDAGE
jgi:transcriptional regulator with PAS, ATPase and Fis domain